MRFGGHVITAAHVEVCDDVNVGGNSALVKGISEPGNYMGYPLQSVKQWARILHVLGRPDELRRLLKQQRDVEAHGDADGDADGDERS